MEVGAVAGQVRERLRHEGRDQAALLGHRLDHVAVEDGAVAGGQRVGVGEVLLELPVRVLVIGRVHLPPERVHVTDHVGDEVERAGQRPDVVAGLLEGVEGVGELDPAVVGLPHQEVLELTADLELESGLARAIDLAAQNRARAVGPRLTLDRGVAREPADLRPPGELDERPDVRDRDQVGVVGRLADVPRREPREPRPVGEQAFELLRGNQLRAGLRVHVDELGEEELNPILGYRSPDVVGRCSSRHAWMYPTYR